MALLTALLLALPLALMSQSRYFCRMMERVMTERCCCHADEAAGIIEAPSSTPEVRAQDCCERVHTKYHKAAASISDLNSRSLLPVLGYFEQLDLALEAPFVHLVAFEPRQARAPPPPRTKLFLKHCSLLT